MDTTFVGFRQWQWPKAGAKIDPKMARFKVKEGSLLRHQLSRVLTLLPLHHPCTSFAMPKTPKAEPSYSHRRHYQKLEFDPEVPYTLTLPLSRRRPSTRETNEAGRQDTDRPVPTPPGPAVPILQSNQEMDVDFREGEGDTPEGSIASTSVRAEGDAGASEVGESCPSPIASNRLIDGRHRRLPLHAPAVPLT